MTSFSDPHAPPSAGDGSRWFSAEAVSVPDAKYLDVILYSREQLEKEYAAMQKPADLPPGDWGIISLKAQDEDHETPMQVQSAPSRPATASFLSATCTADASGTQTAAHHHHAQQPGH